MRFVRVLFSIAHLFRVYLLAPSLHCAFSSNSFQIFTIPRFGRSSMLPTLCCNVCWMISIESHLSNRSCSRILTKRILPSSCITIGYHPQDTAASFSFSDTIGFPVTYSGSAAAAYHPQDTEALFSFRYHQFSGDVFGFRRRLKLLNF